MTQNLSPQKILRRAFPGLRESEAEEMVALGQVREYPPETVLTREGARESIFYILLDGTVEVTKEMNDMQSRLMKTLTAGDFFGEMALIHNAPRAATVKTVSPVTVLEIHKEAFTMLLERNTTVSLAMVREVSRRLRENDQMAIEDLRVKARELAEAYQQLAEMDYARHEFLTTIAHELRTPLMAAGGFLQMIRKGMLEGEALSVALDTVANHVQDIVTLTNDLLFLQEMDLILTDFQDTDVGKIVASVLEQVRERAERCGVGMELKIVPNLPSVAADATSLERAIKAIIDNAIKFSPDGGAVVVEVDFNNSWVWVRVLDHGVGIPSEAMPHIFERYYRLDEVGGHLFRGVGLGLSIAQRVIEEHGGRISVDSKLGEGSVFTVYLPLSQVQPTGG